jgi:hypothetical protein
VGPQGFRASVCVTMQFSYSEGCLCVRDYRGMSVCMVGTVVYSVGGKCGGGRVVG